MICGAPTTLGRPCQRQTAGGRCKQHSKDRAQPDETVLVTSVIEAARDNWRAAAWLLERRWPERWARGGGFDVPVEEGSDALDELAARRDERRRGW